MNCQNSRKIDAILAFYSTQGEDSPEVCQLERVRPSPGPPVRVQLSEEAPDGEVPDARGPDRPEVRRPQVRHQAHLHLRRGGPLGQVWTLTQFFSVSFL